MCGFAGWIDYDRDLRSFGRVVENMGRTMADRGPDDSGTWVGKHAAFAHRRLAVVDPAGGKQPMTREAHGRKYTIVYNGELYNTPELTEELKARGYAFRGHSDTEALLLSYIEWGTECVNRLNGIFAMAVWDHEAESLFMARDRLGVKPLFYTDRGDSLVFGSELKVLLAHPGIEAVVDAEGLAEIFVLGPSRTPGHGVFRGIRELEPGWSLVYDRRGLRRFRYWQLESGPHFDNAEQTAGTIRELLRDTVKRQLVSDVPLAFLLSGGLDSSALTAFASQALGSLTTYSVDYAENDRYFVPDDFQPNSDRPWVERVSAYLGTSHLRVVIDTPQLVEALKRAVIARDLPGMADIDASLYLFSREIKKGVTVAVSGECADEIFGGYPWFYREDALNSGTFPWLRQLNVRMKLLSPGLLSRLKPEAYLERRYREALAEVPRLKGEDPREDRIRELFYLNLTRWMPTLLDRKDRMSMATGLEIRVPYCDHRLVEYLWNVPWDMKNYGGREKGILRKALSGLLPEDVLSRKKSPYPKTHNPSYLAAVKELLLEILENRSSPLLPFIDATAVRKVVMHGDESFDLPWFGQLMRIPQLFAFLVQVDFWLRHYKVRVAL